MASILTPDPSAASAQSLVLHGRTLDVVHAVTREEAGKLKEEGEKAREKADKRNMYLLREGGELGFNFLLLFLPSKLKFRYSDPPQCTGRRNIVVCGGPETHRFVQCPPSFVGLKSIVICLQDTSKHSTNSNLCDRAHAETPRHPRDPSLR
jgi:hypothetical protein